MARAKTTPVKQSYFFPDLGLTVEAASLAEAQELLISVQDAAAQENDK